MAALVWEAPLCLLTVSRQVRALKRRGLRRQRGMVRQLCISLFALCVSTQGSAAEPKNWSAPPYKIYGQKLADETMKAHPDLLSVTLHGVPPRMHDAYTMFAGSY